MNEMLRSKNIIVSYGERDIVKNLNVKIPERKISVILGANGCGKSTLLKTFCRLMQPKSGSIILNSKDIKCMNTKDVARHIGLLPQASIAPEGITVGELVSRGRYPYRKFLAPLSNMDYRAISDAMEAMKITDLKDKYVDELSGGQRQRVFIALALAQETDVLFLDEPTTYLDIAYQIEILDLLKELNEKKKTTIVMVLHDINFSAKYADHIFAMKDGSLIKEGTPHEVITADTMREIYGIESVVMNDPVSGCPFMIPCSSIDKNAVAG